MNTYRRTVHIVWKPFLCVINRVNRPTTLWNLIDVLDYTNKPQSFGSNCNCDWNRLKMKSISDLGRYRYTFYVYTDVCPVVIQSSILFEIRRWNLLRHVCVFHQLTSNFVCGVFDIHNSIWTELRCSYSKKKKNSYRYLHTFRSMKYSLKVRNILPIYCFTRNNQTNWKIHWMREKTFITLRWKTFFFGNNNNPEWCCRNSLSFWFSWRDLIESNKCSILLFFICIHRCVLSRHISKWRNKVSWDQIMDLYETKQCSAVLSVEKCNFIIHSVSISISISFYRCIFFARAN